MKASIKISMISVSPCRPRDTSNSPSLRIRVRMIYYFTIGMKSLNLSSLKTDREMSCYILYTICHAIYPHALHIDSVYARDLIRYSLVTNVPASELLTKTSVHLNYVMISLIWESTLKKNPCFQYKVIPQN